MGYGGYKNVKFEILKTKYQNCILYSSKPQFVSYKKTYPVLSPPSSRKVVKVCKFFNLSYFCLLSKCLRLIVEI